LSPLRQRGVSPPRQGRDRSRIMLMCLLDTAQAVEVAGLSDDEIASADAARNASVSLGSEPWCSRSRPAPISR
jgi:hypothetical protein